MSRDEKVTLETKVVKKGGHGKCVSVLVTTFLIFLFLCLPLGIAPLYPDLAHVCHTIEGAQTIRDLGPIYSDL